MIVYLIDFHGQTIQIFKSRSDAQKYLDEHGSIYSKLTMRIFWMNV